MCKVYQLEKGFILRKKGKYSDTERVNTFTGMNKM